jgi:hypothetical protein
LDRRSRPAPPREAAWIDVDERVEQADRRAIAGGEDDGIERRL